MGAPAIDTLSVVVVSYAVASSLLFFMLRMWPLLYMLLHVAGAPDSMQQISHGSAMFVH